MRRFTRLTNAFSKKVENHAHAVALHMMYYNFVRIHKTLRVTPAMAAGVTDKLWEISDVGRCWKSGNLRTEAGYFFFCFLANAANLSYSRTIPVSHVLISGSRSLRAIFRASSAFAAQSVFSSRLNGMARPQMMPDNARNLGPSSNSIRRRG